MSGIRAEVTSWNGQFGFDLDIIGSLVLDACRQKFGYVKSHKERVKI